MAKQLKILSEVHEELVTILSPEEQTARSQALVRALFDIDDLEESFRQTRDHMREEIKAKRAQANRLRDIVRGGAEARIVRCQWLADPSSMEALLVRAESGDARVVRRRSLTLEERQELLPIDDAVGARFRALEIEDEPAATRT
jgi:hypothetical protein